MHSEENSYIYMDDMSEVSQDEDPFETQETAKLQKTETESGIESTQAEEPTEDSCQDSCRCESDSVDSDQALTPTRPSEEMTVEALEEKIKVMMDSFRFLEQLSVDLKENYCNYNSEPLFCIFSLHCPQREKSLKHLYEKIVKVRNKLRKLVQEQEKEKPEISI